MEKTQASDSTSLNKFAFLNTPCAKSFRPLGFALGIIFMIGGIFVLLASYKALPHGVNSLSNTGVWGEVIGYGLVTLGAILGILSARSSGTFFQKKEIALSEVKKENQEEKKLIAKKIYQTADDLFMDLVIEENNPNPKGAQIPFPNKHKALISDYLYYYAEKTDSQEQYKKFENQIAFFHERVSFVYFQYMEKLAKRCEEEIGKFEVADTDVLLVDAITNLRFSDPNLHFLELKIQIRELISEERNFIAKFNQNLPESIPFEQTVYTKDSLKQKMTKIKDRAANQIKDRLDVWQKNMMPARIEIVFQAFVAKIDGKERTLKREVILNFGWWGAVTKSEINHH